MAHRSSARWLAPLALVAFFVALLIVVGASGGGDGESESAGEPAPAAETGTGTAAEEEGEDGEEAESGGSPKRYTVKLGDTPSGIAAENDITVEQLLRLNPDLDPQLLSPGEKIRIRK